MKKILLLFNIILCMFTICSCGTEENNEIIEPARLREFAAVTFNDLTVDFDGEFHDLSLKNVPDGAKVIYENNHKSQPGEYIVKATISKEGFITKSFEAKLTINKLKFTGIIFEDETFVYDGEEHVIRVSNLPDLATPLYENNRHTEIGEYLCKVTIQARNYEDLELTCIMRIVEK